MNTLDIILIIIVVFTAIRCILKGFIAEFLSMAAILAGITGAVFLSGPVGKIIEKNFGLSMWSQIIAFLVCFVVIYIIIKILEKGIHAIFDKLNLEKLDKALGLLLGLFEGFLLIAIIVFIMTWLTWIPKVDISGLLQNSTIATFLLTYILPLAVS